MTKIIPATQFRAHSLQLLDEVNLTGISIIITKRGKEVAELSLPKGRKMPPQRLFGRLKGLTRELGDITQPLNEKWDADQ